MGTVHLTTLKQHGDSSPKKANRTIHLTNIGRYIIMTVRYEGVNNHIVR